MASRTSQSKLSRSAQRPETGELRASDPGAGNCEQSQSPEVADKILESARRILVERGWEGLTVSAISEDAGVYRAAINYHYGGKEGLAAALLDRIIVNVARGIMRYAPDQSPNERVMRTIAALDMLGGRDAQVTFFEGFTHLLRNPELKPRLQSLYRDIIGLAVDQLGGEEAATCKALQPYASMIVAFTDGLIIQQLVEPERDFYPMVQAFVELYRPVVEKVLAEGCLGLDGGEQPVG